MHILVIGGLQFMGREIVQRLVARGDDVTVVHRRTTHDLGPDVRNLQADRNDIEAVTRVLREERADAVIDMVYDWERGTTADHVEAAARAGGDRLQRYIFMSSISAYGFGLDRREDDPLAPDDFPNPYVAHKASSERALFRLHTGSGLPVTTFRPPYVHGPGQPFYREQFFWDRLLDGRPIILPEGGATPMQWVYSRDVAAACVRALEVPEAAGQAFHVAHPAGSQRAFVETLARVAGVEPRLVSLPRSTIQAAGGQLLGGNLYFGEMLDLPPITEVVEKAPRLLGVTPRPLEDALRETFAWYREQPRRPADYAFEDRLLAGA